MLRKKGQGKQIKDFERVWKKSEVEADKELEFHKRGSKRIMVERKR